MKILVSEYPLILTLSKLVYYNMNVMSQSFPILESSVKASHKRTGINCFIMLSFVVVFE